MLKIFVSIIFLSAFVFTVPAQDKPVAEKSESAQPQNIKKTNQRPEPATGKAAQIELFEKATVETMAKQCVKFETEAGEIEMEMFPESARETVRSFLNLAASGAFDTTTFSRVVKDFIIQGGDLFTRSKMTPELDARARKSLPDEPNLIKHERGIVSMARTGEPNSATTNFFILVGEAPHLNGTFAAFGRVIRGMETVDAINKMPAENEKPTKPVLINRAIVAACEAPQNSGK